MLHSMRCNPPTAHTNALAAFDGLVRSCFAGFTGLHPTAVQWQQAARGFAQAGLGLRSCVSHGPAAYLASLGSSIEARKDSDSRFSVDVVASSAPVAAAVAELNKQLLANRALTVHAAWPASKGTCPSASTLLAGNTSWHRRLRPRRLRSALKPASVPEPSWRQSRLARPAWSPQFLFRNCASAWACLMLRKTPGAPNATRCWTSSPIMPQSASLAANAT